jgi:alkanesulfonate monooxygenase SsuD/methylene tetrahydromethanopterin reductase-like flavin-dependent oxidoreductase (luciferase family)
MQWPAPARNPVALAQAAERLGFDLVSTNDHIHAGLSDRQPRPAYESWTLMTWIGAATSRVKLAVCATCLAFRPPIVIAKMTESLDRLTNGRLVLGLGAGSGGPDGLELSRLGLPVRKPADQLTALAEAVEIIRAAWARPDVEYTGEIFHLDGANLEPKADHQIPIWLGAMRPKALALAGRVADGWLASSFDYSLAEASAKRDLVRHAAMDAGRDPDTISCAYHASFAISEAVPSTAHGVLSGSARDIAERLTEIVQAGFNAPHLQPLVDHARQVEILAREVIPEVKMKLGVA